VGQGEEEFLSRTEQFILVSLNWKNQLIVEKLQLGLSNKKSFYSWTG
jgi:hypothetical protein